MKMPFIEIMSEDVEERQGRNDNGFWMVRRQQAYLHQGEPYPQPFNIYLKETDRPYRPGKYVFGGGSFVNIKGNWSFSRQVSLIPMSEALSEMQSENKTMQPKHSTVAA